MNTIATRRMSNSTSSTSSGKSSPSTAVEIGYFGSRGHNLQRFITLNQPVPGTSTPILTRAPAPELGNWQMIGGVGHSTYNALAAKVTRRLSNGFSGLASYTYSNSMDNGSGLRSPGEQLKPQQGDCWECENGRVRLRRSAPADHVVPL